ncbi:class I SAM-dependent methyltransferase [Planococcus sp. ISL-109]|uniref:class I SAM-dependent methyltransferase n=1 Tax=Planococcus sp. ISL-109 TaxID=2819166 RepID=UPI0020350757|nr:class I SAM-dependent methyltransferase [Planococcus sp. ISL-109]
MNGLLLEHIARYQFAMDYVQGRVLDIATGVGYGAQLVAKAKKHKMDEMLAVDLDIEAIKYAKHKYYHPKVRYVQADVLDLELPQKLGMFDAIISFETLEHLQEEEVFMQSLYDMLNPGGTLILSTPFGNGRGEPCGSPFHVHQLNWKEFHNLFAKYENQRFYYQRGVLIEPKRNDIHYPIGIAVCKK